MACAPAAGAIFTDRPAGHGCWSSSRKPSSGRARGRVRICWKSCRSGQADGAPTA